MSPFLAPQPWQSLQVPSCEVLADFYEKASFVGNRTFFWEHGNCFQQHCEHRDEGFLVFCAKCASFWDLNFPSFNHVPFRIFEVRTTERVLRHKLFRVSWLHLAEFSNTFFDRLAGRDSYGPSPPKHHRWKTSAAPHLLKKCFPAQKATTFWEDFWIVSLRHSSQERDWNTYSQGICIS